MKESLKKGEVICLQEQEAPAAGGAPEAPASAAGMSVTEGGETGGETSTADDGGQGATNEDEEPSTEQQAEEDPVTQADADPEVSAWPAVVTVSETPPHRQVFFRKISENSILKRLEYKPEIFNFKFVSRVTV